MLRWSVKREWSLYFKLITSLTDRFKSADYNFYKDCEQFLIGNQNCDKIMTMYEDDFNKLRLILHRDMFLDSAKSDEVKIQSLKDVLEYMQTNDTLKNMFSEYTKFIKLMLTQPATSCVAERFFSAMKFIKNFYRSVMTQKRLNWLSILFAHCDVVKKIDLDALIDEFTSRNNIRSTTFCNSKDLISYK